MKHLRDLIIAAVVCGAIGAAWALCAIAAMGRYVP